MAGRFSKGFTDIAVIWFRLRLGWISGGICISLSPARIRKKALNNRIGAEVQRRLTEELHRTGKTRPGMTATVDSVQPHTGVVPAWTKVEIVHLGPII